MRVCVCVCVSYILVQIFPLIADPLFLFYVQKNRALHLLVLFFIEFVKCLIPVFNSVFVFVVFDYSVYY